MSVVGNAIAETAKVRTEMILSVNFIMAMWSMTGYKKWNMRFGYLRRGSATIVVKLVVMEGCVVCGFDAEDKSQVWHLADALYIVIRCHG